MGNGVCPSCRLRRRQYAAGVWLVPGAGAAPVQDAGWAIHQAHIHAPCPKRSTLSPLRQRSLSREALISGVTMKTIAHRTTTTCQAGCTGTWYQVGRQGCCARPVRTPTRDITAAHAFKPHSVRRGSTPFPNCSGQRRAGSHSWWEGSPPALPPCGPVPLEARHTRMMSTVIHLHDQHAAEFCWAHGPALVLLTLRGSWHLPLGKLADGPLDRPGFRTRCLVRDQAFNRRQAETPAACPATRSPENRSGWCTCHENMALRLVVCRAFRPFVAATQGEGLGF